MIYSTVLAYSKWKQRYTLARMGSQIESDGTGLDVRKRVGVPRHISLLTLGAQSDDKR